MLKTEYLPITGVIKYTSEPIETGINLMFEGELSHVLDNILITNWSFGIFDESELIIF